MSTTLTTLKAYITLAEAAQISQLSTATLRRAIVAKRLSACKPNGRYGRTLIRPGDLTKYIEGNRLRALGEIA